MIGSRVAYQVHISTLKIFLILIYRLSNIILFEIVEPSGVEGNVPTSEPSLPTKSQEDQTDDD